MITYVVFLRGINVSGKNIIKMSDLKECLSAIDFMSVQTYIQSGNIILKSRLDKEKVQNEIANLIEKHFSLKIPVFVFTIDEIENSLKNNPFSDDLPGNKVFFTFLNQIPKRDLISLLSEIDFGNEEFKIIENVLYFYLPEGMAKSKMNNNFFEKKLDVIATGRNVNTVSKMIELSKN